jgi:hypothetical protein
MIVRDDQHALEAVLDSTLVRVSWSMLDGVIAAWRSSAIARWRQHALPALGVTPAGRLRFGATVIATAAAAYMLIRTALPAYAAPGLPWWWYGAIAAGGVAIAVFAKAITVAWPSSLPGRCARLLFS